MRILDFIMRLLGRGADEADAVQAKLEAIKAAAPDLAPQVDDVLSVLGASIAPDNLLSVGPDVAGAVFDIGRGKFKPIKGAADVI